MKTVDNSPVTAMSKLHVKTMEEDSTTNAVETSSTFKPIRKTSITEDQRYVTPSFDSSHSPSPGQEETKRNSHARHIHKKRHSLGGGDNYNGLRGQNPRNNHTDHGKPPIGSERPASSQNGRHCQRRSSSAMRVRELRDVLAGMTSHSTTPTLGGGEEGGDGEVKVLGSQKARLLVASQHRLISRLQDLRHELDSMDNEVARVRNDVIKSRRFFSAMTGLDEGPEWPTSRQMDSAYTSPTSFFSRSTGSSPYSSGADSPPAMIDPSRTTTDELFQSLQNFDETTRPVGGQLERSDSCSSFMSWRSDVELAGVFPEEAEPAALDAFRGKNNRMKDRRSSRP